MMHRYRRYWSLLAGLLILTPLLVTIFAPPTEVVREGEWRQIAPAPNVPHTWTEVQAIPTETDAYAQDHFGLRTPLIRAQSVIAHQWLDNDNKWAAVGRAGWMFLKSDSMIQQSAGLLVRDDQVDATAHFLADLQHALAAQGTRFLVAMPPNSATIYGDMLPKWARNVARPTEYDRMIADLTALGVPNVDLRPALKASRATGPAVYLKHDTHWSTRGALVGFNTMVVAAGHPDWQLDPAAVLGAPAPRVGGDLARMLGVTKDVTEDTEPLILPPVPPGRAPSVVILGDSFTATDFAPMGQAKHVAVFVMNHQRCAFDWTLVKRLRPAEVWWMPTERFMSCLPGVRPTGWLSPKADVKMSLKQPSP
jgi:alginate O-acetyltransferase complex protein AlgJ